MTTKIVKEEALRKDDVSTLKHTTDNLRTTQMETELAQSKPPLLQRTRSDRETTDTKISTLTQDKKLRHDNRPGTEIDNYPPTVICSQNHEIRLSQVQPSQHTNNRNASSNNVSQMSQFQSTLRPRASLRVKQPKSNRPPWQGSQARRELTLEIGDSEVPCSTKYAQLNGTVALKQVKNIIEKTKVRESDSFLEAVNRGHQQERDRKFQEFVKFRDATV